MELPTPQNPNEDVQVQIFIWGINDQSHLGLLGLLESKIMVNGIHIGLGIFPRSNYAVYVKQIHDSKFQALPLHQNVHRQHSLDKIYRHLREGKMAQGHNLL